MGALHTTRIDLPEDRRKALVDLLNARLADGFDLFSQTKQAHWNVKGMDFIQLHELFDDLAGSIRGHVDSIAERATALGGLARGTARMAAAISSIDEYPDDVLSGAEHVAALAERYATFGAAVRTAIAESEDLGDADTADLFTEVSRDVDKHLWFLEAHLQSDDR